MENSLKDCVLEEIDSELRRAKFANYNQRNQTKEHDPIALAACTTLNIISEARNTGVWYRVVLRGEYADDLISGVIDAIRTTLNIGTEDDETPEDCYFNVGQIGNSYEIEARVARDVLFPDATMHDVTLTTGEEVRLRVPQFEDGEYPVEKFVENIWWPTLDDSAKRSYLHNGNIFSSVMESSE